MGSVKLSILIPSLFSRADSLNSLVGELNKQMDSLNLRPYVQILTNIDGGQMSIGEKRNKLMSDAKGEYVCFIDDDDEISKDYLKLIFEKIMPDCCSLTGIIDFDGTNPKPFHHTVVNTSYFENEQGYQRPPNHLNVIRREIASNYLFTPKNHGEDTDWSMEICNAGVLRNEARIHPILYHYKFKTKK